MNCTGDVRSHLLRRGGKGLGPSKVVGSVGGKKWRKRRGRCMATKNCGRWQKRNWILGIRGLHCIALHLRRDGRNSLDGIVGEPCVVDCTATPPFYAVNFSMNVRDSLTLQEGIHNS